MEEEVKVLYDRREAAVKQNNPKEPFDTQKEYEALIGGLTAELRAEQKAELGRRGADLRTARRGELVELQEQLALRKDELNGRRFTLGGSATQVRVVRFSAEEKRFPMEVRAAGKEFTFAVPVSYALRGQGRDAVRREYYRVYSADQSGGLAGELTYTVFELYPDIWVLRPVETRVVNLLENDAELTRSDRGAGEMVVSTAGGVKKIAAVVRLESGTGREAEGVALGRVRAEFLWPDGTGRTFALNLRPGGNATAAAFPQKMERRGTVVFTGLPTETRIALGGMEGEVGPGGFRLVFSPPDGGHRYTVQCPF